MVKRFFPLSLALLAGCALSPPFYAPATPVEVKVPVYEPVYCTAPALANPRLPIGALTATSAPADTLRAYAASVVVLKAAVRDLDSTIEGCEAPAAGTSIAAATGEPTELIDTAAPSAGLASAGGAAAPPGPAPQPTPASRSWGGVAEQIRAMISKVITRQ